MDRRGRGRKLLVDDLKEQTILEFGKGSNRFHSLENSFWNRLWTCHKTLRDGGGGDDDDDDDDMLFCVE